MSHLRRHEFSAQGYLIPITLITPCWFTANRSSNLPLHQWPWRLVKIFGPFPPHWASRVQSLVATEWSAKV